MLALAAFVVVRGGVGAAHLPVLDPSQAATAADAGVRVVAHHAGQRGKGRTATLRAIEPGGGSGTLRLGRGGPVMVDFFATWCHACKIDLTAMKAYARAADRSRALPPLVAVDLRIAEPSTAYVRRFVKAQALPFPVGLDASGDVTDAFGVGTLPTVILVGEGGTVLWRHTGILGVKALLAAAHAHA